MLPTFPTNQIFKIIPIYIQKGTTLYTYERRHEISNNHMRFRYHHTLYDDTVMWQFHMNRLKQICAALF